MKKLLVFVLVVMVYSSYGQAKLKLSEHIIKSQGHWEVIVEAQDRQGNWVKSESTNAVFSGLLDNTFITEDVTYKSPQITINMHVIFGIDQRSKKYRVIALDKEFGTMDIYEGGLKNEVLIVDNLNDLGFKMQDGSTLNYRLSYHFKNKDEHNLDVDFTNDQGKTWQPFQKVYYKRKK